MPPTSRKKPASTPAPAGNVVAYTTEEGQLHWAARDAPHVVKGLADGSLTLVEEVPADAPTVPDQGDAANTGGS